jgi:signal recognition particle subunit SEC65
MLGRKIAKELAIADPTVEEISMAVGMCRIKNIIEPHKAYSRDFLERGRLKV